MKKINIRKQLYENNQEIEIKFVGTTEKEDIDVAKIEELIENFINNRNHRNMLNNVRILRTILRDYNEEVLSISYRDDEIEENIRYLNKRIHEYQKGQRNGSYKIKYKDESGVELEYKNPNLIDIEYNNIEKAKEDVSKIMKNLYSLKGVEPIKLYNEQKALIEIYKIFYNEAPDFTKKELIIKYQTMLIILIEFGVSLNNYNFSSYGQGIMPISLQLINEVTKLYPFGKVDYLEDNISLYEEYKEIIKTSGETIREAIKDEEDKIRSLETIATVLYARRCQVKSNATDKELADFTVTSEDDVKRCKKLIKTINDKIDNEQN